MLTTQEIAKQITSLIKLDIDAASAYDKAIPEIDIIDVREKLNQYKNDHLRHIDMLSKIMKGMGEKPPEFKKDIKGFFMQGFTAIMSAAGTKAALRAMQGNEKLTTVYYKNSLSWEVDLDTKKILEENYIDEQRHLTYIEEVLKKL